MRIRAALLLLCVCLLLGACSPQTVFHPEMETLPEGEKRISAAPEAGDERVFTAMLYFRFGDTALLRQEARRLTLSPNETREKALVSALIAGSRQTGGTALFPEGTQVLSTQTQGGVIYITMNEALLNRYAGEEDEQMLRRELAMAALTATLTEQGDGRSVQVLVRSETTMSTSMRLKGSYFGLGEAAALDPLRRMGEYLPTPENYLNAYLTAWQQRDRDRAVAFLLQRGEGLPVEQLAGAATLLSYQVQGATVALDGQTAVADVQLLLRDADGSERSIRDYPVRLVRQDGAWKLTGEEAALLMEVQR